MVPTFNGNEAALLLGSCSLRQKRNPHPALRATFSAVLAGGHHGEKERFSLGHYLGWGSEGLTPGYFLKPLRGFRDGAPKAREGEKQAALPLL
jgi:hypothetical protein